MIYTFLTQLIIIRYKIQKFFMIFSLFANNRNNKANKNGFITLVTENLNIQGIR